MSKCWVHHWTPHLNQQTHYRPCQHEVWQCQRRSLVVALIRQWWSGLQPSIMVWFIPLLLTSNWFNCLTSHHTYQMCPRLLLLRTHHLYHCCPWASHTIVSAKWLSAVSSWVKLKTPTLNDHLLGSHSPKNYREYSGEGFANTHTSQLWDWSGVMSNHALETFKLSFLWLVIDSF